MEFAAICSKKCTSPATPCRSTCPSAPTGAPTSCAASRNAQPIAGSSCAACSPNPANPASAPPDSHEKQNLTTAQTVCVSPLCRSPPCDSALDDWRCPPPAPPGDNFPEPNLSP